MASKNRALIGLVVAIGAISCAAVTASQSHRDAVLQNAAAGLDDFVRALARTGRSGGAIVLENDHGPTGHTVASKEQLHSGSVPWPIVEAKFVSAHPNYEASEDDDGFVRIRPRTAHACAAALRRRIRASSLAGTPSDVFYEIIRLGNPRLPLRQQCGVLVGGPVSDVPDVTVTVDLSTAKTVEEAFDTLARAVPGVVWMVTSKGTGGQERCVPALFIRDRSSWFVADLLAGSESSNR